MFLGRMVNAAVRMAVEGPMIKYEGRKPLGLIALLCSRLCCSFVIWISALVSCPS